MPGMRVRAGRREPPATVEQELTEAFAEPTTGPVEEQETLAALDEVAELDELVEFAASPLEVEEEPEREEVPDALRDVLADLAASAPPETSPSVLRALQAVGTAHAQTMDAYKEILATAARGHEAGRGDAIAIAALAALDSFARRPDPSPAPAPDIHVHVPAHDLQVHVDAPEIHPPQVTIEAPAPPPPADVHVDVHVPEQPVPEVHVAAASPDVTVELPEQPAPVINVNMPPTPPRTVRVEVGDDGVKRYISE